MNVLGDSYPVKYLERTIVGLLRKSPVIDDKL